MNTAHSKIIIFAEMEMSFLLRYPDGTREQFVVPTTAQIKVRLVVCVCVFGWEVGVALCAVRMVGEAGGMPQSVSTLLQPVSTCMLRSIDGIMPAYTTLEYQVAQATTFSVVASNIRGSSVWHLLHITLLSPRILRGLQNFWNICGSVAEC